MKNRGVILVLFSIVILTIFSSLVSADIIRHPTLKVEIKQNGQPISDTALICYNTFMVGGTKVFENKSRYISFNDSWLSYEPEDYEYVKWLIESKKYQSCFYCNEDNKGKPCESWFYSFPTQIVILYPAYGEYNSTEKIIKPVVYESGKFDLSKLNVYDYRYEAKLNRGGTITLRETTPLFSLETIISFILSLILAVIIESWYLKRYLLKKKGNLPQRLVEKVLIMNFFSLAAFWFAFPIFLKGLVLVLVVGEVFVVFFEAYLIYVYKSDEDITFKESLHVSTLNNLLSFFVGGLVLLIILKILALLFGI
jgi:hypothetical protein